MSLQEPLFGHLRLRQADLSAGPGPFWLRALAFAHRDRPVLGTVALCLKKRGSQCLIWARFWKGYSGEICQGGSWRGPEETEKATHTCKYRSTHSGGLAVARWGGISLGAGKAAKGHRLPWAKGPGGSGGGMRREASAPGGCLSCPRHPAALPSWAVSRTSRKTRPGFPDDSAWMKTKFTNEEEPGELRVGLRRCLALLPGASGATWAEAASLSACPSPTQTSLGELLSPRSCWGPGKAAWKGLPGSQEMNGASTFSPTTGRGGSAGPRGEPIRPPQPSPAPALPQRHPASSARRARSEAAGPQGRFWEGPARRPRLGQSRR